MMMTIASVEQTLLGNPDTIPLDVQIAAVARELAIRARVYPKWVKDKRMLLAEAQHETTAMTAVLHTLLGLQAARARLEFQDRSAA